MLPRVSIQSFNPRYGHPLGVLQQLQIKVV